MRPKNRTRRQATHHPAATDQDGAPEPTVQDIVRELHAEGLLKIVGYRNGEPVYAASAKLMNQKRLN
jgi:hypothetical protein